MSNSVTQDFIIAGCHHAIAKALKQGKAIKCKLVGEEIIYKGNNTVWVCGYCLKGYLTEEGRIVNRVLPVTTRKILKDPVSLMKVLVEEGWVYDVCYAAWLNKDKWSRNEPNALFSRFDECGKEVEGYPDNFYEYKE